MSSVILTGDTSGTLTVSAPLVAGSNTLTLAAATGTLSPLVSATAVTASGTSVDFTGIPSWAKRITVMFNGISTSGTSLPVVRLGTSGGFVITGYSGFGGGYAATSAAATMNTTGFTIYDNSPVATNTLIGNLIINLLDNNVWVASYSIADSSRGFMKLGSGSVSLGATLTQVRLTTINGTDTFDAGSINIMYEG